MKIYFLSLLMALAIFKVAEAQISCTNYTNPNNIKCIEVEGDFFWPVQQVVYTNGIKTEL